MNARELDLELLGPALPAHLYVHVPFCASKCAYCDFESVSGASDDTVRGVFTAIRAEVRRWAQTGLTGVLETVYFGGGTPSRYPEEVVRTLEFISEHLPVREGAEVTVEANPDSLDDEVVGVFAAAGVNRISVGVQSFDDSVLRVLGRRHDAAAAWAACRAVRDVGLDLSVDLICGVPGQSLTSWSETLNRAAETGAVHASVYPLSVEEGTPLQVAIDSGLVSDPDPDTAAEMMLLAEATLRQYSFERYEIANYAFGREHESRHNTAYWTGRSYLGIGPGAHGMLDADSARVVGLLPFGDTATARVRYANAGSIDEWLLGGGDATEMLAHSEVLREDVMLGMRLTRGVAAGDAEAAGVSRVLEELAELGLVELASECESSSGARWRMTQRGWLLGNVVFSRVWAGE